MLVMAIEDGLTVGNRVYRKGELFKLEAHIESAVKDRSAESLARYQTGLYGKPYFRRATAEEIYVAYNVDKITADMLNDQERRIVKEMLIKAKQKQIDKGSELIGEDVSNIMKVAEEEKAKEEALDEKEAALEAAEAQEAVSEKTAGKSSKKSTK